MSFTVGKAGALTKQIIKNVDQSDGRCGVECSVCDWSVHIGEMNSEFAHFEQVAIEALQRQSQVDFLSPKRQKITKE
jgi:hypothetical protein